MKVIFLDFDGCLNSANGFFKRRATEPTANYAELHTENTEILNWILEKTGAAIVVSSSWRCNNNLSTLKDILSTYGVNPELVVDTTPHLKGASERGIEIQMWLDQHPEVNNYVIIDDNDDMAHLSNYLFQTDSKHGLTFLDAIDIVCTLNNCTKNEALANAGSVKK